jgi:hypothetical protein
MEPGTALETVKAIHEAGMTATVELVAELQSATLEDAYAALEALVVDGRLYSSRVNAGDTAPGDAHHYTFASYVPLVA